MGVLLDEVVKAMRPEHQGHRVDIAHAGDPVVPTRVWWRCSCGLSGNITAAEIREALDTGKVTAT
jgi:hypothetical protein